MARHSLQIQMIDSSWYTAVSSLFFVWFFFFLLSFEGAENRRAFIPHRFCVRYLRTSNSAYSPDIYMWEMALCWILLPPLPLQYRAFAVGFVLLLIRESLLEEEDGGSEWMYSWERPPPPFSPMARRTTTTWRAVYHCSRRRASPWACHSLPYILL